MTFEELKSKAERLKTQRDQALGAIKNIEDGWERKYGTRDVKAVTEKFNSMQEELNQLNVEYQSSLSRAEEILAGAN